MFTTSADGNPRESEINCEQIGSIFNCFTAGCSSYNVLPQITCIDWCRITFIAGTGKLIKLFCSVKILQSYCISSQIGSIVSEYGRVLGMAGKGTRGDFTRRELQKHAACKPPCLHAPEFAKTFFAFPGFHKQGFPRLALRRRENKNENS